MPLSELARQTAELLSVEDASQPRSLNQLVTMATRQVRGCSGATASIWQGEEPVLFAASHPDLPALIDVQLQAGRGPLLEALAGGGPVSSPDTLEEMRWPEYCAAALVRGIRCSVTLATQRNAEVVTLSLYGSRPRLVDLSQVELAELLIAFGGAAVGNAADYGNARRAADQLREAAQSRTLVDQAKGMLMQALGCDAEQALAWLRRRSQQRNERVADVASKVIAAGGQVRPGPGPGRAARGKAAGRQRAAGADS